MGYDIADYEDIHPNIGLLRMDKLINGLENKEVKLIMDLAANHTSNQVSYYAVLNRDRTPSK